MIWQFLSSFYVILHLLYFLFFKFDFFSGALYLKWNYYRRISSWNNYSKHLESIRRTKKVRKKWSKAYLNIFLWTINLKSAIFLLCKSLHFWFLYIWNKKKRTIICQYLLHLKKKSIDVIYQIAHWLSNLYTWYTPWRNPVPDISRKRGISREGALKLTKINVFYLILGTI